MVNRDHLLSQLNDKLQQYQNKMPNEKVFLHLDRNFYQTGDSIWFKAYINNQHFLSSSNLSPTLHVLLMGPDNRLVKEELFLLKNASTHGNIKIPEYAPMGTYNVVSYTSFMKNYSPEHAFMQEIQVAKVGAKDETNVPLMLDIQFADTVYQEGNKVIAELVSKSFSDLPEAAAFEYSVRNEDHEVLQTGQGMIVNNGKALIQFDIPEKNVGQELSLQVQASLGETYYHTAAFVPFGKELVDFQLFPEGGNAIVNLENKIAFKAVNQYGNPVNVEGWLQDDSGKNLKKIRSFYEGMGFFTHYLKKGKDYQVLLEKPYKMKIDFPEIIDNGILMNVIQNNEDHVQIFLSTNYKHSEKVSVIMTLNGQLIHSISGYLNGKASVEVSTKNLGRGIATITLFNREGVPVAERLLFVNKNKTVQVAIKTDKYIYQPREKVNLEVKVTDHKDKPVKGNFSLAVVDSELDINSNDNLPGIESYLLLTSELKGKIPNPGFYFEADDNLRRQALDMLMLTHGWRKFTPSEILNKDWQQIKTPGHQEYISGVVERKNDKSVEDAQINYLAIEGGMYLQSEVNNNGEFTIHYPYLEEEGKKYVIHAQTEKNKKIKLKLNIGQNDPYVQSIEKLLNEYERHLNENLRELYGAMADVVAIKDLEDLGKYQLLQEVTIESEKYEKPVKDEYARMYTSADTRTKKGSELLPANDFFGLLRQTTPVQWADINSGRVVFGGRNFWNRRPSNITPFSDPFDSFGGRFVLFIVDGMPYGYNIRQLDFIRKENIDVLTVVRYPFNNFYGGFRSNEGIVFVKTKNIPPDERTQPDRDFMIIEGYQVTKQFYAPKYDTPETQQLIEPDLRSTIFWTPNLETNNEGVGTISFYNHDRITTAKITAEGITEKNEPVSGKFEYLIDDDTF